MLIANPLRLKGLEEEGKVDLSKVRGADMHGHANVASVGGSRWQLQPMCLTCLGRAATHTNVLLPVSMCCYPHSTVLLPTPPYMPIAVLGLLLLQVSFLVLDEADKLLAMGFAEQVDALLAAASNPHITRALFSATLPDKVRLTWSNCRPAGTAVKQGCIPKSAPFQLLTRSKAWVCLAQRRGYSTRQEHEPLAVACCQHSCCLLWRCCRVVQVEALARSVLRDPLHITVGERNTAQVRPWLLPLVALRGGRGCFCCAASQTGGVCGGLPHLHSLST